MLNRILSGAAIATLLATSAITAQDTVTAFTGAQLYPIGSDMIESGTLIIHQGKIVAVGADIEIPEGAIVIDASDKVIMPGLVDTHSHIALTGDGGPSAVMNPEKRIMDAVWPADPRIKVALTGGVTTANIMPGSGTLMGGQTAYVKLRGDSIADMLVPNSIGGMKMANGTNPKRSTKAPATRMASAAIVRQKFLDAQDYMKKIDAAKKKKKAKERAAAMPPRDLGMEALMEVLNGARTVHHHTHRSDDIRTVLRLKKEFGFRLVIQHGTESYMVADEIAAANVPVSLIVIDSPGGKHEAINLDIKAAKILDDAGVKLAIHTDDGVTESRYLLRSAALAVRGGLSEETALASVTQNAADMMDLGDRIGSLEAGKDADFVLLDGHPLSVYTHVTETWIDGVKYYDRSDPAQRTYHSGGYRIKERYIANTEMSDSKGAAQ